MAEPGTDQIMSSHDANRLDFPHLDSIAEILANYKAGEPGHLDGRLIFRPEPFNWDLDSLRAEHPEVPVNTHELFALGMRSQISLGDIVLGLKEIKGDTAAVDYETKRSLYGVVNCRRLRKRKLTSYSFHRHFGQIMSFLWVGTSTGSGLHYDPFDNVLLQLQGKKKLTVFPAEVSNKISKLKYVLLADPLNLFCHKNLKKHRWLNEVPYYEIVLSPGDAVAIPSGAYHTAKALTNDSISINAFVSPKMWKSYSSEFARKDIQLPWWIMNIGILISRWKYYIGKEGWHAGPYEFM